MYNGKHALTINSCMEVYCLLMTPRDMLRFFSIHTIQNKWMWGVDFLWDYFNIKVGLYNKNSCIHMLPSAGNSTEATICMHKYFEVISHNLGIYMHTRFNHKNSELL